MAIKLFQLIEMREKHCEMKIPQGVNSEEIYLLDWPILKSRLKTGRN